MEQIKNSKIIQQAIAIYLFIRFPAFGCTVVLPFLGAATVTSHLSAVQMMGFLGVSLFAHIFAYVTNDIIDLPLDRTELRRSRYPLVKGSIKPTLAFILALLQIPFALGLTYLLHGNLWAYITIFIYFFFISVYNLAGKRCFIPLITDAIQGIGWSALLLYGVLIIGKNPRGTTLLAAIFIVVFVMMVNGVHGSLRDITNDFKHGVHSTAIYLGCRPLDNGSQDVTDKLKIYVVILQSVLMALTIIAVVLERGNYERLFWVVSSVVFVCSASIYSITMASLSKDSKQIDLMGLTHVITTFLCIIVALMWKVDALMAITMMLIYVVPAFLTETVLKRVWIPLYLMLLRSRI